jgi:WD40 repeat protein
MWSWLRIAFLAVTLLPNSCMGASQTRQLELKHGKTAVTSVRFMPDGKRFISVGFDGTVVMWDVQSGKRMWQIDLDEGSKTNASYTTSQIIGMDLSWDGSAIALSYSQGRVVGERLQGKDENHIALLDSRTGQVMKVLINHTDHIGRIAFSPNGELLLSENADSTARLWSVNTGQEVLLIKLKERGAAVAFSPDGKLLAVATQPVYGLPPQPIVGLYDAQSGRLLREFPRLKNTVISVAFSPNKHTLAIASGDLSGSQIELWELNAQVPTRILTDHEKGITSIAFSPDGRLLASGALSDGRGIVVVRDLAANAQPRIYKLDAGVSALDFSPAKTRLVVGTDKGQVVLLSLQP